MRIFDRTQLEALRVLDAQDKDTYKGYVYVCEYGNFVKIGSTSQPYTRFLALIRQGENYGDVTLGRFGVTKAHTNYRENEKELHDLFAIRRQDGTELFNVTFDNVIAEMGNLELKDETMLLTQKSDMILTGMKDFVIGRTDTPTFSNKPQSIIAVSNVRGFTDNENKVWLDAEDVATGFGFTQEKNGVTYVKWERVNSYLREFGYSPQVGKGSYLPENMVYRLGFKANNQIAMRFQAVLADEVLPSIRKKGGYIIARENETPEEIMARALVVAQDTLTRQKQRIEALAKENLMLQAENEELRVKSDYVEKILASNELMAITQIAQDYGLSGKAMNQLLYHLRVQYKVNGQWVLYEKYKGKGYTQGRTFDIDGDNSVTRTYWRQKGRLFLYELLKKNDILPLIERD